MKLRWGTHAFTGRYLDSETGLTYFRARYHSTALGRFASRDPLGHTDGINLYAAYFVPTGLDPNGTETCMIIVSDGAHIFVGTRVDGKCEANHVTADCKQRDKQFKGVAYQCCCAADVFRRFKNRHESMPGHPGLGGPWPKNENDVDGLTEDETGQPVTPPKAPGLPYACGSRAGYCAEPVLGPNFREMTPEQLNGLLPKSQQKDDGVFRSTDTVTMMEAFMDSQVAAGKCTKLFDGRTPAAPANGANSGKKGDSPERPATPPTKGK